MIVNFFKKFSQPVREPLPAPLTEVRHDVLCEAVSILLSVRQQLQRIDQFPTKAWLTLSLVCNTKSMFGCFQSTDRAPPIVMFSH